MEKNIKEKLNKTKVVIITALIAGLITFVTTFLTHILEAVESLSG